MTLGPQNPEVLTTLDDAVMEVLGMLTGLNLTYEPELDRYAAITRQLNRALRANALEAEWSYYNSTEPVGVAAEGENEVWMTITRRPRIINDDAVRLVDDKGVVRRWAYFLPRDAIHKYQHRRGLWVSSVRQTLIFSRPFTNAEDGLEIQLPVMREPIMFRLPKQSEDPEDPLVSVPQEIRDQPVDFAYPDVIVARAAYYVAQSDPVMQPRAQTLESEYKDMMYQLIERDTQNTDSPYLNQFSLPIQPDINGPYRPLGHPGADGWYA